MKARQLLLSKWFYYVLIALVLIIFIVAVLPYWIQKGVVSPDLGNNLFAESWGLLFTVLLLVMLFELGETLQWKSVKDKVYERISRQLFGTFIDFTNICECTHGGGVGPNETMDEFSRRMNLTQLEELNKKVELNEIGKKHLPKGAFAPLLEAREQFLSTIEAKYFKFLDSEIIGSLMEIQDNLHALTTSIRIKKGKTWLGFTDEQFFKEVSVMIHNIVKEIYKIHTQTSIEVIPPLPKSKIQAQSS